MDECFFYEISVCVCMGKLKELMEGILKISQQENMENRFSIHFLGPWL